VAKTKQFLAWSAEDYAKTAKTSDSEAKLWGKITNAVCIPMLFKGTLKGAVAFYDVNFDRFALDRKLDYLQALANQIAIFLENARLYRMVIQDRLTGLFVHSFIEAELENMLAQASRYQFPVSFIMFDVDKFKQINDQYGHTAGNHLLKAVSKVIRDVSRDADSPGRYGGDEFEIILPHTDKPGAQVYAEKLRKGMEEMDVDLGDGVKARVTISVGLASYPQDAASAAELQAAADSALYGAKAMGRNCVVLYEAKPKEKP
jgi:diguanylate cyclase (GGDEF)-like protein